MTATRIMACGHKRRKTGDTRQEIAQPSSTGYRILHKPYRTHINTLRQCFSLRAGPGAGCSVVLLCDCLYSLPQMIPVNLNIAPRRFVLAVACERHKSVL